MCDTQFVWLLSPCDVIYVLALISLCSGPLRGHRLVQDQHRRGLGYHGCSGRVSPGFRPLHQHLPVPQAQEGSYQQGTHVSSHIQCPSSWSLPAAWWLGHSVSLGHPFFSLLPFPLYSSHEIFVFSLYFVVIIKHNDSCDTLMVLICWIKCRNLPCTTCLSFFEPPDLIPDFLLCSIRSLVYFSQIPYTLNSQLNLAWETA